MLKLENVTKVYNETPPVTALDKVSLELPNVGLVAILGKSGCGKTSLLNIIGGLDNYTDGDLKINGISTKDFKAQDWDNYRASNIGFVFQAPTIIPHLTVLENVKLALKIIGVPKIQHDTLAKRALAAVGLSEHIAKLVSHLSEGEKQRVEIARAIVKKPKILLADEPTGSLDEECSQDVMRILKQQSESKLVIWVTHKKSLATQYADRIININKGKIDKNKETKTGKGKNLDQAILVEPNSKPIPCNKMKLSTVMGIALSNLFTRRFLMAAAAISFAIGIGALSLVLSMTTGFNNQIRHFRDGDNLGVPIMITSTPTRYNFATHKPPSNRLIPASFTNIIDNPVTSINTNHHRGIRVTRAIDFNIIERFPAITGNLFVQSGNNLNFQEIHDFSVIEQHYEFVYGTLAYPGMNQVLLVLDRYQPLDTSAVNRELRVISNDYFFEENNNIFSVTDDLVLAWLGDHVNLTISGIIRPKGETGLFTSGFVHTRALTQHMVELNRESQIVMAQHGNPLFSVTTGEPLTPTEHAFALARLGQSTGATMISILPNGFSGARQISSFITNFNSRGTDTVYYTDAVGVIRDVFYSIITVLIIFAVLTLVLGVGALGMITWITVATRNREIALMRSLGASKSQVSWIIVFEALFVGILGGILGMIMGLIISIPLGSSLYSATGMNNLSVFSMLNFVTVFMVSIALTLTAAFIPANKIAKQDVAKVLRGEQ